MSLNGKYTILISIIAISLVFFCGLIFILFPQNTNNAVNSIDSSETMEEQLALYEEQLRIAVSENEALQQQLTEYVEQEEFLQGQITEALALNMDLADRLAVSTEETTRLVWYENYYNDLCEQKAENGISVYPRIMSNVHSCISGQKMLYALYIPEGIDISKPHPLILYLHGLGECGTDLSKLANSYSIPSAIFRDRIAVNAYILMPQCPDNSWAYHTRDVMAIITDISKDFSLDMEHISVTGHSLGGYGTISMLLAYPDFFYAAAPLSATVNVDAISNVTTPIWFFVGSLDSPQTFMDADAAINAAGGNSRITIYEGEGHPITHHYLDDNCALFRWLSGQEIL